MSLFVEYGVTLCNVFDTGFADAALSTDIADSAKSLSNAQPANSHLAYIGEMPASRLKLVKVAISLPSQPKTGILPRPPLGIKYHIYVRI